MRLIDADAFEANMQNEWERNEISNGEWIRFREMLNEEPTIETRNGKWIFYERREQVYDLMGTNTWANAYRCSECGFIHTVIEDFGRYVFCPSCGADMRGEEDALN